MAVKVNKERSYMVVKGNDIITRSRFNLTVQSQRMLLYCISKIQREDNIDKVYEIEIKDFIEVAGLEKHNGYVYLTLKEELKALADSSLWIRLEDGRERLFRWLNDIDILPNSGKIQFTFHKSVKPYLFELQSKYTKYELIQVLSFRSKYSIRIYEYLKSYSYKAYTENGFKEEVYIKADYEEFKKSIFADYTNSYDMKRFVLDTALKEINTLTNDIRFEYSFIKEGRRVKEIVFHFLPISFLSNHFASDKRRKILNKEEYKNERNANK